MRYTKIKQYRTTIVYLEISLATHNTKVGHHSYIYRSNLKSLVDRTFVCFIYDVFTREISHFICNNQMQQDMFAINIL